MGDPEAKFRAYDIKVAERIASLETTVHETVIPLLQQIQKTCAERCATPPQAPPPAAAAPSTIPNPWSTAWFWGKIAGAVTAAIYAVVTIGVAAINKAPEVIAAIQAAFDPSKRP